MIIIGVDFHPEFQQIASVDTGTGELNVVTRDADRRNQNSSYHPVNLKTVPVPPPGPPSNVAP
jgi:hypothetical protein